MAEPTPPGRLSDEVESDPAVGRLNERDVLEHVATLDRDDDRLGAARVEPIPKRRDDCDIAARGSPERRPAQVLIPLLRRTGTRGVRNVSPLPCGERTQSIAYRDGDEPERGLTTSSAGASGR